MDSQTAAILSAYLPPEIVLEIDDYLITAYRGNANRVQNYFRHSVKNQEWCYSGEMDAHALIVGQRRFNYTYCHKCGELKSRIYLRVGKRWKELGIKESQEADHCYIIAGIKTPIYIWHKLRHQKF